MLFLIVTTALLEAGRQLASTIGPFASRRKLESGSTVAAPPPMLGASVDWMILVYILAPLYALVMLSVAWNIWSDHAKQRQEQTVVVTGAIVDASSITTEVSSKPWTRTVQRGRTHWDRRARAAAGAGMDLTAIHMRIRFGFLRKVYAILSTQLLITFAIVLAFISSSFDGWNAQQPTAFYGGVMDNYWVVWLAFVPLIALICILQCVKNTYPHNYLVLFLFTIVEGCLLGIICVMYYGAGYGDQVVLAAALTVGIFLALTAFTLQSKWDWSWLGPALCAFSLVLFLWLFFTFWMVPYSVSYSASSAFSFRQVISLLFCILFIGFIIYDTHMIMKYFGVDDYIIAAIELYLDFVNLFLWLLSLLSAGSR